MNFPIPIYCTPFHCFSPAGVPISLSYLTDLAGYRQVSKNHSFFLLCHAFAQRRRSAQLKALVFIWIFMYVVVYLTHLSALHRTLLMEIYFNFFQ